MVRTNNQNTLISAYADTLRHGMVYGIGSILSQAVGFLLIPIYTAYLSPAEYGILSLLIITGSITIVIFQLGLFPAVFRSYFDYKEEKQRSVVISTAFYSILASTILLNLCGYFVSPLLASKLFDNTNFAQYLYMIFLTSSIELVRGVPLMVYRIEKMSVLYTTINLLLFLFKIVLTIFFVVFQQKGIMGVLLAQMLVEILFIPIIVYTIKRRIVCSFSKKEFRKMLLYGAPLVLQDLAAFMLISADSYFLKVFCNMESVGLYNLGYKFGMIIQVLLVLPLTLIWPALMLSIKDEAFANKYYSTILSYYIGAGLFVALGISLFSREALILISPESFWQAYKIVPVITLSYLFVGCQRLTNVGIELHRKTTYNAAIYILSAVLNLFLNFILIPLYGMMGAAVATFISYAAVCLIQYPISMKFHKVNYEWKRIQQLILSAFPLYCLAVLLDTENISVNIVIKIIVFCAYPPVVFLIGFLNKNEKEWLMKQWRKLLYH